MSEEGIEHSVYTDPAIDIEPIYEWVQSIHEPVLWICMPPRSGGTLLLRLLDSHPQIHTYPSVFGFNNPEMIWPTSEELTGDAETLLTGSFNRMSLAKFHRIGLSKQSSNMPQDKYPIYFDQNWFRSIFLKEAVKRTERNRFDALFTAVFNAWRNYQGLYYEKKYVLGHMTMRRHLIAHYAENFRRFQIAYPDGRFFFITREPEDWLASFVSLKKSTPYTGDPHDAVAYYKAYYRPALELVSSGRLIVIRFKDLVTNSESLLRGLTEIIGIDWNPLLLCPTFNGAPWYQNSSFELSPKAVIDTSVLGQGKNLPAEIVSAIDDEMRDMHKALEDCNFYKNS